MYYKIAQANKHGLEVFVIAFFDAKGKETSTHQYLSRQACMNKLNEIKFKLKSAKVKQIKYR